MNVNNNLAIAYAADDGYAQHLGVSLYSLLASAALPGCYTIYILDNALSQINRDKLSEIAAYFGQSLNYIDISNIESRLPVDIDTANLSISTYCRLFVTDVIPKDIDILLYLDCDTFINDDITHIIDFLPNNDGWMVAGVEDTMYPWMKDGIGMERNGLYLNAGVLLINLRRWRETGMVKKFIDFINIRKGVVPHLDQGVINGVFRNGKIKLPLRYNVQSPIFAIHKRKDIMKFFSLDDYYDNESISEARSYPAIIHYTSFFLERPWFRFCIHPLKDMYRTALEKTPFAGSSLSADKIGLTQKIKDLCFRYLQPIYLKIR